MKAKQLAMQFNALHPPKKIEMIDAYWVVLEDGRPFWAEAFIPGEFKKHNNNARWQEVNNARNTPQSFSHFTAEVTECELMVVDVQGVGDLYTDPQIHSTCGTQQYGVGNLGHLGMAMFFQTHVCNDLCRYLGLSPFARQDKSHAGLLRAKRWCTNKTSCGSVARLRGLRLI